MKQKAVINYAKLSIDQLVTKSKEVLTGMSGKPEFPNPIPSMADYSVLVDDFALAVVAAKSGTKSLIAKRNNIKDDVLVALKSLATYVNLVANDNLEVLRLSGLDVTKDPQPSVLATPENIQVLQGDNSGTLQTKFDRVEGASSYIHMCTPHPLTPASEWQRVPTTRTKFEFTNLEPGTMYWFKVVAVGSKDQTTVSEPVSQFVQQRGISSAA